MLILEFNQKNRIPLQQHLDYKRYYAYKTIFLNKFYKKISYHWRITLSTILRL